tara:strand:+ start:62 stop:265 length:204 start_codon:yes stop_codon:yes gene_type:complete
MDTSTTNKEENNMSKAIDYFFALSLFLLGFVVVYIALGEGNQSHQIAGWATASLGLFLGVTSEFFKN